MLAAAVAAAALWGPACGEADSDDATTPTSADTGGIGVETYRTRGIVRAMGDTPNGPRWQVEHERIESFRDAAGEVVGMEAMVMPFPVKEGTDVAGIAVGDKVEIEFEVQWRGEGRGWRLTEVEPLPPDTELELLDAAAGHDH